MHLPSNNTRRNHSLRQASLDRAFTLIELMVVMSIMAMLLTLSMGVSHSWKAQKLNTEAHQLAAQMAEISLLAQKDNYPVEFRFYLLPDDLGEGSATAMRAFQVARLTGYDSETQKPVYKMLTEVRYFDDDIILMDSAAHTSLISQPPVAPAETDPEVRGERRSYRAFMFLPNGATSLPRSPDAVFTLVKELELKDPGTLPPNYRSIILQPVTGKATVY